MPAKLERFRSRLLQLQAEFDVRGVVAAFSLPDGRIGVATAGLARPLDGLAMVEEARMPAGSIGKTFAAALAIALAQEGRLDLDARVADWFGEEEWFEALANHETMTVRHLLTHSSGLRDHVFDAGFRGAMREARRLPHERQEAWFTPLELVAFLAGDEAMFPAGEGFFYTDTGYVLLGLVLLEVLGPDEGESGIEDEGSEDDGAFRFDDRRYYREIERRFLEPLRLDRTEAQIGLEYDGLADGWLGPDNSFSLPADSSRAGVMELNPRTEFTGGGFISNARDLARWGRRLYGGKLFEEPYLREMLESGYRGDDRSATYGLGVFHRDSEIGAMVGHGGWFPGWRSSMYYHLESDIVVALQINQNEPDLRDALLDALMFALQ